MIRHVLGLLICSLALCSCSDGFTGPDLGPTIFQGTLIAGGSNWHSLTLIGYGGVWVELVDVTLRTAEGSTETPDEDFAIGFGLGEPRDGVCVTTFRSTLSEGGAFSFGIGNDEFCFLMFDSGLLTGDAMVDYTLVVTL